MIKKRHFVEVDWKDVTQGLRNLYLALKRDKQTTIRMNNSGDLLEPLPPNKMTDLLSQIFRSGDITFTLCHGRIEDPPVEMRPKIIGEYHNSLIGGHKGITKTYRAIRERYTWPGLRDQITEFIRGCKSCFEQKLVRARTREAMLITDNPAEPFDKVSLDTVGKLSTTPNGNCHILTMQDNFSKYSIAVPIRNIKTTTIAYVVATALISQYCALRAILTDRGGSLVSKLMRKLEKLFNVNEMKANATPGRKDLRSCLSVGPGRKSFCSSRRGETFRPPARSLTRRSERGRKFRPWSRRGPSKLGTSTRPLKKKGLFLPCAWHWADRHLTGPAGSLPALVG